MNKDTYIENLFRKIAIHDSRQAFKELFFEFYPALCIFAERYVHSKETSEDIVQEAFLKIWKNRKTLDINVSFRNFLITTVKNGCMDYLRRQSTAFKYAEQAQSTAFISPEELYTLNELETLIREGLEKLHPDVRQVFEMSRFEGLTYNEIAVRLSISPKTVESRMSKALKLLKNHLKDYVRK